MSQETTAGEKALYLILGAAIGAATALLLAPRSGEETRKLIMARAREGAEGVATQTRTAKEKTSELVERGREVVHHQRDSLNAALEAGKKAYREEKGKV